MSVVVNKVDQRTLAIGLDFPDRIPKGYFNLKYLNSLNIHLSFVQQRVYTKNEILGLQQTFQLWSYSSIF